MPKGNVMSKINLPNKLTVLRMCLVPVVMLFILYPSLTGNNSVLYGIIPALLFIITAITDFIDGKIARKYNLITDFGKFMDPVADKFMVIGTLMSITFANASLRPYLVWVTIIVIFRELAITSIRLVVSGEGIVVAANWLGKCKTMTQSIAIVVFLIEHLLWDYYYLSYVGLVATAVLTLWSGFNYIKEYWKYIDPTK
ncbi:MAG: CDP-diacylglycerol--glycerol-3-phosphate 3-phosphatidyltransferase [Ruminococcaceae bacterium]|nr:CDP-diacylglycerol--glycerol-3-phosphate 3-phosphatidyltransferase [Oscillospiraceae bacterium]